MLAKVKWALIGTYAFSPLAALTAPPPVGSAACDALGGSGLNGKCTTTDSHKLFGTTGFFHSLINIFILIIGAIAVLMLIIGGLRFVTSNGDSKAVNEARNTIIQALVGIIIAVAAYAIAHFVITSIK